MTQFGICEKKLIGIPDNGPDTNAAGVVEQCGRVTGAYYSGEGWFCHDHRPLIKEEDVVRRRQHNAGMNRKARRAKAKRAVQPKQVTRVR